MSLMNRGLNIQKLYEACKQAMGPKAALCHLQEQIGALMIADDGKKPEIQPEDFSMKELWEFCELNEDVGVTQFPILTGLLISKKMMDTYEAEKTIGDQLVTKFPSKLLIDRVTGAFVKGNLGDIEAGMPYEHTGDIDEKYVQIVGKKRGAILDVTWEAVNFDQTGQVLREAGKFGTRMAVDKEGRILNWIQDIAGSRCYYPTNTQTNLYQAAGAARHTYGNLINDALQNWQDIGAAYNALALMKDDNGDPILIDPKILLVPKALETVARRLINNTLLPATRTRAGVGDSPNEANPWSGRFTVLSSPYLDAQSSVIWFLGDFVKQFLYKECIAPEVLTRKDDKNDAAWERDILASYKLRYHGIVGAVDYRYVCKSSGTMGQVRA
jgi:hypothetical protein